MALMQKLRDKTHIILWAVLILFILSMTFGGLVGGANITDLFSGKSKLAGAAGMINKKKVDGKQFSRVLSEQIDVLKAQGRNIDTRTMDMMSDRVWNSFVNEYLIQEKIEEMKFTASDNEISYNLRNNPPDFLRQQQVFLTDGKFDMSKYLNLLNNPQGDEWYPVEQQLRYSLPLNKINNYIYSLATVSDKEIEQDYIQSNIGVETEVLTFPGTMINVEDITITDKEIEKYYKDNKEDYFVDETRDLNYVSFKIAPKKSDSLSVLKLANDLIARINKGEDFKTVATEYTEDESGKETGGDLGWFEHKRMVKPFSDAAFAAKIGEITDPVLTQFGYHIIKVEEKRNKDGKEEVKARHILLKINAGPETISQIRSQANFFAYDVNEFGFEAAADTHNTEIKTVPNLKKDSKYISGIGLVAGAARFAFSNKPIGASSELFSIENQYVLFQLKAINEEHYKKIDDVKEQISNKLKEEKKFEEIKTIADNLYNEIKTTKNLQDATISNEKLSYAKNDTITLDKSIGNLGKNNTIIGTLLALEPGNISKPIKINNKYVIVKLLSKSNFDKENFDKEKINIKEKLLNAKKQYIYGQWLTALRDNADIIDNRDNMYR